MENFAMLTPHEQLVKHKNLKMVLHNLLCSKVAIFRNVLSRINGILCGRLEIPGGAPGPRWESLVYGEKGFSPLLTDFFYSRWVSPSK